MNALRIALGIFSGKIILNFGVQKRLRAFLNPIFTGRGFGERTPPVACGDSPLWDGAFGITVKFPAKVQSLRARQRLPPRGSWQNRQVLTEGVSFQFLFFCTKCSAGRVFLLTSGQMFRTIISSMESKTLYAGFCVTLYPFQAKRACLI